MKYVTLVAIALLALTGCATEGQDDSPSPGTMADAEAGCAEVVGNEYEPEQRPPSLDVQTVVNEGGIVTLTGIARGDTDIPADYEFTCRTSEGETLLASFEIATGEAPPTSATSGTYDPAFDELADSLTDEQYETVIHGLKSRTAELRCSAEAGRNHIPESSKPFTSDFYPPTPYRGGFLVEGKIQGADGVSMTVGCRVSADGDAEVTRFDISG